MEFKQDDTIPKRFQFTVNLQTSTGIVYTAVRDDILGDWTLTWDNRGAYQVSKSSESDMRNNLHIGFWVIIEEEREQFIELGD